MTIDLREGRDDQHGGKATISATQFGLNLEGPITDRGSYLFSARRSYLDLIFKAAGFSFVPEYWDFFGKFNYKLSDSDYLSGIAIAAIDRVRLFNDDQEDIFDNSRLLDNSQDQLVAGITWKHLFSNGYLNTTLGRTRTDFRFRQTDSSLNPIFTNNSLEDEYNLRLDALWRLEDDTELSFGGNAKTVNFQADVNLTQQEPAIEIALEDRFYKGAFYAQASRSVVGNITATLGGRVDYFSGIQEQYYPSLRLALTAPVSDLFTLSLSGWAIFPSTFLYLADSQRSQQVPEEHPKRYWSAGN